MAKDDESTADEIEDDAALEEEDEAFDGDESDDNEPDGDDDADADDDDADEASEPDEDDAVDEDDDDEDDEDDDEGPVSEAPTAAAKPGARPRKAKPGKKRRGTPASRAAQVRRARRSKRRSPTRNVILFVVMVVGLGLMFFWLGQSGGGGGPAPAAPKWKVGQTVTAEITIVTTDYKDLSCAMVGEVKGRHCAFETQNKKHADKNGDTRSNPNLLQPFTTTNRIQFMAAGLWMQPPLKAKLDKEDFNRPSPRFTVKCKYKVEGKSSNASVQWKAGEGWHGGNGWYTGTVSNCKIE